jgi:isoleucyl-tRNA synthetase
MRRLGASVDWSREFFTMEDRLNVAVNEAFVRLWEQGFIYRGSYIVNWDPIQQTAVSDLEVTHEDRAGKLYEIRYPFADGTGSIVVATTRPETMLGDTAVAVNPNDERYQEFIGKLVTLPLSAAAAHADREIPILADDWAQPEFGTGAVKVTPAHDPNDFAIGQRHNLPAPVILDETAHVNLPGSPYHGLASSPTSKPRACWSPSRTTRSPSASRSAPAPSSSRASPPSGSSPSTNLPLQACHSAAQRRNLLLPRTSNETPSPETPSPPSAMATLNSPPTCTRRPTWSG